MNDIKEITKNNIKYLDEAKLHTQYKIKYIKDYVEKWLNVATNCSKKNILFIDCMCNAGIYKNGVSGTCVEVVELFIKYATNNKNKTFYVFLNDYDQHKIKILKELLSKYNLPLNLKIKINNMDVVDYLKLLINNNILDESWFTLLYIDPYNFGVPDLLSTIKNFVNKYYCEVLFNYFSSDIARNKNNKYAKNKMSKIKDELSSVITDININYDENREILNKLIKTYKNTKNIKYSFAYRFNNKNNTELYYIIFFTPNKRGLELIKESIWKIFNGEESFKKQIDIDKKQLKLFETDSILINKYSEPMKLAVINLLTNKKILSYEDIETYILENSLLKGTHIINQILKPLIESKKIIKITPKGFRSNNYTKSKYQINDML